MASKRVRWALLLLALMLLTAPASAEIAWPQATTAAQVALQAYVARVNENLLSLGQAEVNSLFEYYPFNATLGVTSGGGELPEGVELSFTLYGDTLNTLVLRVSDADRFSALAASCIQAASPSTTTMEEALDDPSRYARKAKTEPDNSFEDEVLELNGTSPRTYYAYYPNRYHDGVNWLQMTLIFPLAGYQEAGVATTPTPPSGGSEAEHEGYFASDDLNHLEVFTTATPEPDSPAGEWYESNP